MLVVFLSLDKKYNCFRNAAALSYRVLVLALMFAFYS